MAEWDVRHEIEQLNGELFATQTLLVCLLEQINAHSPQVVKVAFDNAINRTEIVTIAHGSSASPHHLARALQILEQLRSQVIPGKPAG